MEEPAYFLTVANAVDFLLHRDWIGAACGHLSNVAAGAKGAALAGNHYAANLGVHRPLAKSGFDGRNHLGV